MIRVLIAFGVLAIPMMAGVPPTVVPEPSSMLLMGGGLVALGLVARRRNRKK